MSIKENICVITTTMPQLTIITIDNIVIISFWLYLSEQLSVLLNYNQEEKCLYNRVEII